MKVVPTTRSAIVTQAVATTAFHSAALTSYRKSYQKQGHPDRHERVFASLLDLTGPLEHVLYPGCHRHITASLVFPAVDYVDCDPKVAHVYEDGAVRAWILTQQAQKEHPPRHAETSESSTAPRWTFTCASYNTQLPSPPFADASYDLLISLSAGVASTPCARYLKEGSGYLLVNDSHGDASCAFVTRCGNTQQRLFVLHAVWYDDAWETSDLHEYFLTTKSGEHLTPAQAREAAEVGSKSKRSYRLQKEAPFYLFRKVASHAGLPDRFDTRKGQKHENKKNVLSVC